MSGRSRVGSRDLCPRRPAIAVNLHAFPPSRPLLIGRIGIFVSHAKTVSLNNDRLPVMHQPVDQGRCQGVVHIKEFAPFPEGTIRGDHDRSNFITGGDNLEQQIGPALVDGQIAQLIEEGCYRNAMRTLAHQPTVFGEQDEELNGS